MEEDAAITIIAIVLTIGEIHIEAGAVAVDTQMQDPSLVQIEGDWESMHNTTFHQKSGTPSQLPRKGKSMRKGNNTGPIKE